MKVLVINGNTKQGGFIFGALSAISAYLASRGVEVKTVRLHEMNIEDCIGCFNCLKTGRCILKDDMEGVIRDMLDADGFVIGSPVRNGLTTACYKRFYERITYTLGFPLLLEDKYTLAVSSVGYMGGKSVGKRHLGLQDVFHSRLSDFLFFKVGVPTRIDPDAVRGRLEKGAEKFLSDMERHVPRAFWKRMLFTADRAVMGRFMLVRNPEQYAHVIRRWREKKYL